MTNDKCEHLYVTEKSPMKIKGELVQTSEEGFYTFKVPALYSEITVVCDSCGEELQVEVNSY